MAHHLGLEFAGKSDTGLIRSHNEDAIAISSAHGFAVLADGMGGYNAGEVASSMAATITKDFLERGLGKLQAASSDVHSQRAMHQLVVDAIGRANTAILEAAHAEPQYEGMGTTLVAAVFQHDKVTVAHVGDSRAYRFRQGELEQITRDHSLLQEQIDAGLIDAALARNSPSKNLVTRAVGVGKEMEVEIHDHATQPGDLFLLCSDGLSDMLPKEEIRGILAAGQGALNRACEALVQKANDNGGLDNISVVLIRVRPVGGQVTGILGRMLNWIS